MLLCRSKYSFLGNCRVAPPRHSPLRASLQLRAVPAVITVCFSDMYYGDTVTLAGRTCGSKCAFSRGYNKFAGE